MGTVVNNERGGPEKCAGAEPEGFKIHRALARAVATRESSGVNSIEQPAAEPRDVDSVEQRGVELRVVNSAERRDARVEPSDVDGVEQRGVDPSYVNNVEQRGVESRVTIRVARRVEPRIWNIVLARGPVVGLRPPYSVVAVAG
jgi:hypothetical protein